MPDGWDAFTAAPGSPTAPAAVMAAPAALAPDAQVDPWVAFAAPAASPGATPSTPASFAFVAPRHLSPDEPGFDPSKPEMMVNMSPEDWAKFNAGVQPSPDVSATPPGPTGDPGKTGYIANVGAGGNAAIAGTVGLPVDLMAGGLNLAARGINAAAGTSIPPIADPVGGSASIRKAMGLIGANPDDVKPDGLGEELARGVGGGLVSSAIPAGAVAGLVRGGAVGVPAAARTLSVLGDLTPQNALLGAASGGVGEVASSAVPNEYGALKPVAGLVGGVAGVAAPLAVVEGGRGALRAAGVYLAPVGGRVNPLLDAGGQTIADYDGAPINMLNDAPLAATAAQARLAGDRLASMTSDPATARAVLDAAPAPVLAGDNPTSAQLLNDPRTLAAERGILRTVPGAQGKALAKATASNEARVGTIRSIAPDADSAALPAELQRQASEADAASAAHVAGVETGAAADVARTEAAGEARVAGVETAAERARADAEAGAGKRLGGLRQTADQATTAMGGDLPAGSANDVGAALRAPVSAANQAAWTRIHELAAQVDPDGTLGAVATPVREVANAIDAGRTTYSRELSEPEAKMLDLARAMPDQLRFRDLKEYRSQLTDGMMTARQSGKPTGLYSDLIKGVDDAMNNAVTHQAARDAAAVRAGTMRPEDAISARVIRGFTGEGADGRTARQGTDAILPGGSPAGGARPGRGGYASSGGQRNGPGGGGRGAGDSAMATGPATQGRAPETLREALIRAGGVKDESGEFKSQDLDRIHHRGGGRLVNPNGMSHDYAREFAVEQGFLPQSATVNDFRDAVINNPVRIDEAADASVRSRQAREGQITDDARFASGANIDDMASLLGVKLSRAETDHAVLLHMLGADPEDAIRQAAHSGDESVFQRNAEYNAVGSPGVPIAARQAEMPITDSGPPVVPMDAEAAARYAAYRAAVRDRGATFGDAPGVGQILQPGRFSGDFKVPDTAVPNIIVRVDAAGADVAKAYLKAGGDPAALSQAAAFSLRQHPGVMRADGTLDPSKVEAWAQRRAPFLSVIPETGAKFIAVADAQRALDVATKAEAKALADRDRADVVNLRTAKADATRELREATTAAKKLIDDAAASRARAISDRQNSAVGKFVPGADPSAVVGSVLRDPRMGATNMARIAYAVKGDPDAVAGLRRSIAEHILTELKGNKIGAGGTETFLKGDQLQTLIRTKRPALEAGLSPEDMTKLQAVADSLARSDLSVSGSKMAGSSDSVQIAAAASEGAPATFLGRMGQKIGAAVPAGAAAAGGVLGGPLGAVAGFLGASGMQALQASREAGLRTVDDLVANALLNPQLMAVLLTKVTPANQDSLGRALVSQLRRISLVGAAQGNDNRRDAFEPPRNALLH